MSFPYSKGTAQLLFQGISYKITKFGVQGEKNVQDMSKTEFGKLWRECRQALIGDPA